MPAIQVGQKVTGSMPMKPSTPPSVSRLKSPEQIVHSDMNFVPNAYILACLLDLLFKTGEAKFFREYSNRTSDFIRPDHRSQPAFPAAYLAAADHIRRALRAFRRRNAQKYSDRVTPFCAARIFRTASSCFERRNWMRSVFLSIPE